MTADSTSCCTADITENCANMTDTCHWECRADNTTEHFCVGGTNMYMGGFAVKKCAQWLI